MVHPDLLSETGKVSKDSITPHKVALLVLIQEFCHIKYFHFLPKQRCAEFKRFINSENEDEEWQHTWQQNRDFCVHILKLIQSPDKTVVELLAILQPILHEKTFNLLKSRLSYLWHKEIVVFMDYIESVEYLLTEAVAPSGTCIQRSSILGKIQRSSILGLFIRHMWLAFDKLSFGLITKLYHDFREYAHPDFYENTEGCSPVPKRILDDSKVEVFASQKQAEFFIAQQVALLQINESAALSPYDLQLKIKEMLRGNPHLYEACYLSFLNSLRIREYCGARDSLFHHFDRNTSIPVETKIVPVSDDANRSSRYAALNLAILHATFGHKEEALAALNEAIKVAQEVNDNQCLQYALAWLYKLTSENKECLIERSIAKSVELGLWGLTSLGIQALTKIKSFTSAEPKNIFDLLVKSDLLNCQYSMVDMIGPSYTLRAGLWSYYGIHKFMSLCSQMLLYLNTVDEIHGKVFHIGEGFCLALRNLAMDCASVGKFTESMQILSLSKNLFSPYTEHSAIWKLAELTIKFQNSLYLNEWSNARCYAESMAVFDKDEALIRQSELFLHQGHLSQAESILRVLQKDEDVSPHFHARVLLLKSEVISLTPNVPAAIEPLMTCLEYTKKHKLLNLWAMTKLQIASVQQKLMLCGSAIEHIEEIFILVLTHGTNYEKGVCCDIYCRCLAMHAKEIMSGEELQNELQRAITLMWRAYEWFKSVKAVTKMKSALTFLAYIYDFLGMQERRNSVAYIWRNIEDEIS